MRTGWMRAAAAALGVAGMVVLTAGCASTATGEASASGSALASSGMDTSGSQASTAGTGSGSAPDTDWMPQGLHAATVDVTDGGTADLSVGQLVTFVGPSAVNMSVDPDSLDLATFYGDPDSLLLLRPGTLDVTFPNYDKHFDCPNGPCAHPNEPLHMTVTITGSGQQPDIPDPVSITAMTEDRTVHLVPGQRVTLPRLADLSQFPGESVAVPWSAGSDAGSGAGGSAGGSALVAYRPGTATYAPVTTVDSADAPLLTIVVDAP